MAIKMVREPSDSPNITNLDDFVGLRYAYGDQNGYVLGKGSEIDYSISGSVFKVLSGRVVVQGVECDIDANGVSISIDNTATLRYHAVYIQVALADMSAYVLETYDTASYPNISKGDDLNSNTTGTARLLLYTFTSRNGVISSVAKKVEPVSYTHQKFSKFQADLENGIVKPLIAETSNTSGHAFNGVDWLEYSSTASVIPSFRIISIGTLPMNVMGVRLPLTDIISVSFVFGGVQFTGSSLGVLDSSGSLQILCHGTRLDDADTVNVWRSTAMSITLSYSGSTNEVRITLGVPQQLTVIRQSDDTVTHSIQAISSTSFGLERLRLYYRSTVQNFGG